MSTINTYNTAIRRRGPSAPIRHLVEKDGLIKSGMKVLDFGCGRGEDVDWLVEQGVEAQGWDPHAPFGRSQRPATSFEVVTAIYVVNIIPSRNERLAAVEDAWGFVADGGYLVLVSRSAAEILTEAAAKGWRKLSDGFISSESRRTFQKGHDASDLQALLSALPGSRVDRHITAVGGFEHAVAQKRAKRP